MGSGFSEVAEEAGSSGEFTDDTNESSVLVFQPLVIGTQIDKNLWREGGGDKSERKEGFNSLIIMKRLLDKTSNETNTHHHLEFIFKLCCFPLESFLFLRHTQKKNTAHNYCYLQIRVF